MRLRSPPGPARPPMRQRRGGASSRAGRMKSRAAKRSSDCPWRILEFVGEPWAVQEPDRRESSSGSNPLCVDSRVEPIARIGSTDDRALPEPRQHVASGLPVTGFSVAFPGWWPPLRVDAPRPASLGWSESIRLPVDTTTRRVTGTGAWMNIGEIAERAGVSRSTVSYALSGKRPVSEETRVRIQRVIDELGYRPNAAARALKE